uniref:Uncharacterized protein n=1 Tax=Glossina pallidipes TaxID=7398 RepID=A0A1A9ZKY5_GLOPL
MYKTWLYLLETAQKRKKPSKVIYPPIRAQWYSSVLIYMGADDDVIESVAGDSVVKESNVLIFVVVVVVVVAVAVVAVKACLSHNVADVVVVVVVAVIVGKFKVMSLKGSMLICTRFM